MTDYVRSFSGFSFSAALESMKGFAAGEAKNNGFGGGDSAIQMLIGRASWLAGKAHLYSHFIQLTVVSGVITDINEQIPTLTINRTWNPSNLDLVAEDYQTTIQVP